ncbi:MAG: hypothetical protein H0T83_06895 [Chthoniobacterales bacterium]|nr:hypothetical protein [Chthoniobacterales bacterium]
MAALADLENSNGLSEVEWYAGPKLLVKLSFPKEVTDDEALKAISALQESEAVEKVVVQSAANLEFKSADFARSWKPDEVIPDAARRGFDVERLKRSALIYDEKIELPSTLPIESLCAGRTNTSGMENREDLSNNLPILPLRRNAPSWTNFSTLIMI